MFGHPYLLLPLLVLGDDGDGDNDDDDDPCTRERVLLITDQRWGSQSAALLVFLLWGLLFFAGSPSGGRCYIYSRYR